MLEAFVTTGLGGRLGVSRAVRRLTNSRSGERIPALVRCAAARPGLAPEPDQTQSGPKKSAALAVARPQYQEGDRVILFDGVCNVCNFGVDTVLRLDDEKQFKFASLQGTEGIKLLQKFKAPTDLSTMVYIDGTKAYLRSDAILHIGKRLPLFSSLSSALLFSVPKPIRDWLYTEVLARNRYRLFGKRSECRIPTAEEQALFLD